MMILIKNGQDRPTGSCTVRKCDIVGVGVVFLEEVFHYWLAFTFHNEAKCHPLFLLPANSDVKFSAPSPGLCLTPASMPPAFTITN